MRLCRRQRRLDRPRGQLPDGLGVRIDHETPSPHTVLGQKGSGESGYLGAPAAIANAVNDALKPLGISHNTLPLKVSKLGDLIAEARAHPKR